MKLGLVVSLYLFLTVLGGFVVPLCLCELLFGRVRLRYVGLGFLTFLGALVAYAIAGAFIAVGLKLLGLSLTWIAVTVAAVGAAVQEFVKWGTTRLAAKTLSDASGIGLGCGLVETLGVAAIIAAIPVLLHLPHLHLPQVVWEQLQAAPLYMALACIERLLATMFHVGTCIAYLRDNRKVMPIVLSIVHWLIDTAAIMYATTLEPALLYLTYIGLTISDTALIVAYA